MPDSSNRTTAKLRKSVNLKSSPLCNQRLVTEFDELTRKLQDLADDNEALSQASARFQHLFQEIPNPTFSFETSGAILEWNRAFANHQKVVGLSRIRPVWELVAVPTEWAKSRDLFDRVIRGDLVSGLECECRLSSGAVSPVLYNAFPLRTPLGEIVGGIGTYHDITELKRSEQEKTDHTNQQLAIMELGQLALSGVPLQNLIDEACRLVCDTIRTSYSLVLELIDNGPELFALAGAGWPAGFLGSRFMDERPAGANRFERVTILPGIVERSSKGEDASAKIHRQYAPIPIVPLVIGDLSKEFRFAGYSMLAGWGVSSGLAVCIYEGTSVFGVLGAYSTTLRSYSSQEIRFVQAVATTIASALQRHRAAKQIEDYTSVLEKQKQQLEQANARLEMLATVDGLTGLKNHRFFQEQLSIELQQANRRQQSLSLILIDVDHFKRYNDTYGHPEGDEVLRMVALILRRECRAHDIVARYGGEEFVLVLPETGDAAAAEIAERIRKAIEQEPWPNAQITASFGIAAAGGRLRDGNRLIAEADRALYMSKNNGRNCITVARNSKHRAA